MNKIILIGGFLAVLIFGTVVATHAVGMEKGKPVHGVKAGMAQIDPAKFEQARLDRMKEKLGLSDGQVSKLKALFESHRAEMKPLQEKIKTDMDTLRKKKEAKASDTELKAALDALSADQKSMRDIRQKHQEQIRGILTSEQQAKMVLERPGMGKGKFGKGNGHWGGKVETNTLK
jgi:Spy/CpxP family protein refolding chaperone